MKEKGEKEVSADVEKRNSNENGNHTAGKSADALAESLRISSIAPVPTTTGAQQLLLATDILQEFLHLAKSRPDSTRKYLEKMKEEVEGGKVIKFQIDSGEKFQLHIAKGDPAPILLDENTIVVSTDDSVYRINGNKVCYYWSDNDNKKIPAEKAK